VYGITILQDEVDASGVEQYGGIFERVAVDDEEIGCGTGTDLSEPVEAEGCSGARGGGDDPLHGGQAAFDHAHQLARVLAQRVPANRTVDLWISWPSPSSTRALVSNKSPISHPSSRSSCSRR
jgi:hypothetical protein